MEICENTTSNIENEENGEYGKMQIDEELTITNEIIVDELYNIVQKGIYEEYYCIRQIKQYIVLKNKNENEIFNYLLDNKDKLQNILFLAIFYHYKIGTYKK